MKLSTLLVPTLIFLLGGAFAAVSDQRSLPPEPEHRGLDMMVIGETISPEHLQNWAAWKQSDQTCESCVLSQAYPGDSQTQVGNEGTKVLTKR